MGLIGKIGPDRKCTKKHCFKEKSHQCKVTIISKSISVVGANIQMLVTWEILLRSDLTNPCNITSILFRVTLDIICRIFGSSIFLRQLRGGRRLGIIHYLP